MYRRAAEDAERGIPAIDPESIGQVLRTRALPDEQHEVAEISSHDVGVNR